MGISLWEIVHIFHVVRFYFCLPIRMVRLSYKRTTLYGSHGRFSRPLSLSLFHSLSLLVYLRIDEIPFTGLSREREPPREENRGEERRKKGTTEGRREREEEGTRCGGSRVG